VTTLDWLIVGFTLLLAFYGFLRGFIVGVLSLAGFALGAVVGTRVGPALLPHGSESPYAPLFGLAGALLAGGILASGLEGIGARLRRALRIPGLGFVDGVLGAVLTACVALGVVWIAGAVALQTPGIRELRAEVRGSAILKRLNAALPPSGAILHLLARFDPLPSLEAPQADVPPPSRGILRRPPVRRAFAGVVRVTGTACGLGIEGSGWAGGDGLVVTNAHVVAGEDDTAVQVGGQGVHLTAMPVVFDPRDDIAVLRVPGLRVVALPLAASPSPGTGAAILGFPENGAFDAEPGRLGATRSLLTQDAYGRGPVRREVVSFRGLVRSGNSGGPLVDARGRVVATVFASIIGAARHGGLGVPDDVVRAELARARGRAGGVGTGQCAG
jgi:hypothetical protein